MKSLSDCEGVEDLGIVRIEDVKEFIKKLKDNMIYRRSTGQKADFEIFNLMIDKLAGDKLVEKEK